MLANVLFAALAAAAVSASPMALNARPHPSWAMSKPAPSHTTVSHTTVHASLSTAPVLDANPPHHHLPVHNTNVSDVPPPHDFSVRNTNISGGPPAHSFAARSVNTTDTPTTPNPPVSAWFIEQVETAATEVLRFGLLSTEDPTHGKFDFNPSANPTAPSGAGGEVILANRANFPSVIGQNLAAAVGFMNPCGLNTPHIHPRSGEFLTLVKGDNLKTGLILENGFTVQQNTTLSLYQGTIFPQGSIHFQFNDNCEDAVFVSGLSNEDPGASSIAQNFFNIDPAIVDATLGFPKQIDANNFAQFKSAIPPPFALGAQECLQRCGIKH